MPPPNLADLIVEESAEEIEQDQLAVCQAQDLPTTSWFSDAVSTVLIKAFSIAGQDLWATVSKVARGFVLELSDADWIPHVLKSQYQEELTPAGFTFGDFLLVDAGGGPHTITANVTRFRTADGENSYVATTGGTLSLSGSLVVSVRAELIGSGANIPNSSTLEAITSLPTVTVTNPPIGTTGTWITQLGVDQESVANAQKRAAAKWATLSTGSPVSAYLYWALSTSGVTRAKVDDGNPDGPGTLRVYIDNSGSVAALQTTLTAKAPAGTLATAVAATTENVTIPATLTVQKAFRDAAESAVTANLVAYALRTDIGGILRKSQLIEELMSPAGVVDAELGSSWVGSPNHQLGSSAIPQFTLSLTWVEV